MGSRYINFSPRMGAEKEQQYAEQFMTLTAWYYKCLQDDGDIDKAFYDVEVKDLNAFMSIAYDPKILFYLVLDSEKKNMPVGHFILNSFQGRCAQIHINILKKYRGLGALDIGVDAIRQIFKVWRADKIEGPALKGLIGLIPQSNRAARGYAVRIGFKRIAKIVEGCYIRKKDTFEHGILYQLNNVGWRYGVDNRSRRAA